MLLSTVPATPPPRLLALALVNRKVLDVPDQEENKALQMESEPVEGPPGSLLQPADGAFERDGSESGARPATDGNDSDSSTYSSASSARGVYATLAAAVGEQYRAPYTVQGREIAAEAVGRFPSLQEVLQAASDEQQHLLELEQEQEREGPEPRSRRDSFSSRYPHLTPLLLRTAGYIFYTLFSICSQ